MILIELFISSTCPHCPKAKLILERVIKKFDSEKIEFHKYRINTEQGREKAGQYRILSVPALVVEGNVMSNGFDEDKVFRFINMYVNPKPSIFKRIFGKK